MQSHGRQKYTTFYRKPIATIYVKRSGKNEMVDEAEEKINGLTKKE